MPARDLPSIPFTTFVSRSPHQKCLHDFLYACVDRCFWCKKSGRYCCNSSLCILSPSHKLETSFEDPSPHNGTRCPYRLLSLVMLRPLHRKTHRNFLRYLVDRKLGACRDLLERDIPVLAVPLEDHVHEAQEGDLLLREGRTAHQGGLCRHRLGRGRGEGRGQWVILN